MPAVVAVAAFVVAADGASRTPLVDRGRPTASDTP
jgi:hypothetical protein